MSRLFIRYSPDADYPTTTKWLSEREKALAVARLVSNEDNAERLSHRQAFVAAVKDLKTWVSEDCSAQDF